MSTRALKKAQKRAEEERLAALAAASKESISEEEEEEDAEPVASNKQANLFAMLNAELEEQEAEDQNDDEEDEETESTPQQTAPSSKKKKNKKKKKKGKSKAEPATATKGTSREEDEDIDAILQSLKSSTLTSTDSTKPQFQTSASPSSRLQTLLHIDPRHLDLENEMRKLFGRAAASRESTSTDVRQRGQPRIPGGRPLLAAGGRRNVFVQPGENWPREGSGGLSMEFLGKSDDDGTALFKYVHSRAYQDVQRQFGECVRSMDPERMITHMHSHPYHISTLLQVSHIATTQSNDHTTSQQLISRALFSLGRSSHSLFPTALSSGSARLSFDHFENRELYFAGWKYILTLSRRGLWRTGLEFVRTLLQLDPLDDPLCLSLIIDQYALKSRSPEVLLSLSSTPLLQSSWTSTPNILYSLSLAHFMTGDIAKAKEALKTAIEKFPYILTKLHGSLTDGGSLPNTLWGLLPPSETDSLLSELYTLRMGDLWNIPENSAFLTSTISGIADKKNSLRIDRNGSVGYNYIGSKMRNLARHVFLMDAATARSVIGFLPREYREDQGYAWDILPPLGMESKYQKEMDEEIRQQGGAGAGAGGLGGRGMEGSIFEVFLRSLLPSFQAPAAPLQEPGAGGGGGGAADIPGQFEVGEEELQATLIAMVDEGIGFPQGTSNRQRAEAVVEVGMVPAELRPWFEERFGVPVDFHPGNAGDENDSEVDAPANDNRNMNASVEDGEEGGEVEEEEERQRDSRAIDRLVQILGTGDPSSLRMRVDRMFEGQGEEMAEVRRRVEERLGLR
ncbi:hypothetical protein ABW19_dt0200746 [Dactylella cylindrospora]|nr:hypothetical protein ABW19_dt0200746 [Dactylella cylindrospora]